MTSRMLAADVADKYDLSSLTAFSLASAPSSEALKQKLRENLPFATALVDSYGLTETSTGVSAAAQIDLAEPPGPVGRPAYGVRVEISNPHGRPHPVGDERAAVVARGQPMPAYLGNH